MSYRAILKYKDSVLIDRLFDVKQLSYNKEKVLKMIVQGVFGEFIKLEANGLLGKRAEMVLPEVYAKLMGEQIENLGKEQQMEKLIDEKRDLQDIFKPLKWKKYAKILSSMSLNEVKYIKSQLFLEYLDHLFQKKHLFTDTQITIFKLHQAGKSFSEIGEIVGVTKQVAHKQLKKVLNKLKDLLQL